LRHPGFIILEFIAGFVFGVSGGYAFSFFDRFNNLDTSIVLAFTSAFIALLIGVGIIGYIHLKKIGRAKYFGQSVAFSLLGLLVFVLLYILIELLAYQALPYYIGSFLLPIILPLTGAVLGFNFKNYKRHGV
jgi:ABC-type dipeptide/oligopeptide/nickel transport system permease component